MVSKPNASASSGDDSNARQQLGESSSGSDSAAIEFPSAAADKRARQRQHVRRSYYRRLNRVQGMREEIQRLEERYARLLKDKEARSAQEVAEMAVVTPLPTRRETITELYRHLTKLKDQLREENAQMEELVEEYSRFSRTLERFQSEEIEAAQQQADAGTVDEDVDLLPLTADECHALARDSYQEIMRFTQSHAYVSSGQQVFGWRDRRQLVDDQVRFIITKTFNGRDAEELTSRAWRLTTTPQGVKELYSSTMNMAVRRMQVVDGDNVVIYRTISNPARTLLVKSLFLASRFRVGTGYILLYRSIDKSRLVTPKGALTDPFRKETWLDMFTWNQLDHVGEEGTDCRSSCGGIVPSTRAATPDVWMLEVLLLAVRWESKVVGPMFSLKG